MSYIKIIRLKSGKDIISFIEHSPTSIKVIHPVAFYITFNKKDMTQELLMNFWLPLSLVADNSVSISMPEILFITEPKDSFKEYYLNFLNQYEINALDNDIIKGLLELNDLEQNSKLH